MMDAKTILDTLNGQGVEITDYHRAHAVLERLLAGTITWDEDDVLTAALMHGCWINPEAREAVLLAAVANATAEEGMNWDHLFYWMGSAARTIQDMDDDDLATIPAKNAWVQTHATDKPGPHGFATLADAVQTARQNPAATVLITWKGDDYTVWEPWEKDDYRLTTWDDTRKEFGNC